MTSPGINVHHHANDESWAQKVAKGLQAKVPAPMNCKDLMGDQIHYTAVTLYEDEQLKDQIRIHRAEQIIQQTLEEEAVLFELPKREFSTLTEAYTLIQDQIGIIDGVTPLNRFGSNTRGNLLETLGTNKFFSYDMTYQFLYEDGNGNIVDENGDDLMKLDPEDDETIKLETKVDYTSYIKRSQ
ncbi:uncharacterized protein BX664DRAFT_374825 [Halteromyces radiatus]|uniref:uncharacterized protein n=1 Tax=Halteromyces radiatus TaxID=101107 RepID=UPI00221EB0AD|nr:uncharacterized protein BX664DRAFT_374825 [Halteromyces radiatus]KAI8086807.1 hypothetical protein BX664DRAFT_374825 [Halteromyces radiatus]